MDENFIPEDLEPELDAGMPLIPDPSDEELEAALKEPKKKKKKKSALRIVLIVLCVLLSLVLVIGVVLCLWVNSKLNKLNYITTDESRLSLEEVEELEMNNDEYYEYPEDNVGTENNNQGTGDNTGDNGQGTDNNGQGTEPEEDVPNLEDLEQDVNKVPDASTKPMPDANVKGDVVNILLVGQDRRSEKRARSDSMILVTINKDKNTITFTSFLRDAYVKIPGYKPHKLCHAFQYGGFSLLNETLWVNYGVRVDGNAEVDFNRFMGLIDVLGGVDIKLTKKEVNYMTNNGKKWPELKAGMNHLTGEQALLYSRIRYIDTDYRRTERQRTVLMSLLDEYKSKSTLEMLDLLDEILPLVTTNMEKSEIITLAKNLFPMAKSATIKSQQIPAAGTFKGGSVRVRQGLRGWFEYNIDFEENREILRKIGATG